MGVRPCSRLGGSFAAWERRHRRASSPDMHEVAAVRILRLVPHSDSRDDHFLATRGSARPHGKGFSSALGKRRGDGLPSPLHLGSQQAAEVCGHLRSWLAHPTLLVPRAQGQSLEEVRPWPKERLGAVASPVAFRRPRTGHPVPTRTSSPVPVRVGTPRIVATVLGVYGAGRFGTAVCSGLVGRSVR
jgi:hypothetical protein